MCDQLYMYTVSIQITGIIQYNEHMTDDWTIETMNETMYEYINLHSNEKNQIKERKKENMYEQLNLYNETFNHIHFNTDQFHFHSIHYFKILL